MLDLGLLDLYLAAALALLAAGVYLAARAGALPGRTPAVLLGALLAALGILAFQRRRRAALERRLEALRAEARARAERLEALRDEVQASEEEVADIFPILRQENTFDGVMWTMPFNKSLYLLFYNEDLLKQYNLKVPETWEDLLAASRALTREEGGRTVRYGFVVRPTTDYFLLMLITNGGEFLRPGNREVAFNSEAGVEGLQFLVDLVQKHKVAYVLSAFADADFGASKVAMYYATSPGLAFAKAAVAGRFTIGLAQVPYRKTRATLLSGTDVAIMAKAAPEQQAAAWKYIKFITGTTDPGPTQHPWLVSLVRRLLE